MKYALLIFEDENAFRDERGRAWAEILAAHQAFAGELATKGVLKGGAGLKTSDTATTARKASGQYALHDGPYAEAREQLGGFYIVEAASLDEALTLAKRAPLAGDGSVEVRPLIDED